MAESLPYPPRNCGTTPQDTQDEDNTPSLTRRLDELLEQYLELLDQYTVLRKEMSTSLAAGFFSLARAQHTSSLGPGRRYGEDGFDGRMKALKQVKVTTRGAMQHAGDDSRTEPLQSEFDMDQLQQSVSNFSITHQNKTSVVQQDEPFRHASQASEPKTQSSEDTSERLSELKVSTDTAVKEEISKSDPGYRDPATWYSILVPPLLRQAQQSFSVSVDRTLPELLNNISSMNIVETQIRGVRKRIALDHYSSVKIENQIFQAC